MRLIDACVDLFQEVNEVDRVVAGNVSCGDSSSRDVDRRGAVVDVLELVPGSQPGRTAVGGRWCSLTWIEIFSSMLNTTAFSGGET
ncbi:MAG TPA: hypothetical protein VNE42_02525 [Acidimicrobiales bacterium]|nr:hypothetical protein [Acidimicrobiales bacterium]